MIKQLFIVVGAAASTAALVAAVTWPGEAQQRTVQQTAAYVLDKSTPPVFDSSYTAGMRIIHVPQVSVSRARATTPSYRDDAADEVMVDVMPVPPPHKRVSAPQPRRIFPSQGDTKRTVLNTPKVLHDGPSPVRPLPRWRDTEKFTELPKPVNSAPTDANSVTTPVPSGPASAGNPAAIDDDEPPPAD